MKGQYCSSAENSMKVLPGWKVNSPVRYHRIWWYITDDVFDHFNCIWVREFERSNFHIIILNYYLIFLLNLFLYYIVCQKKMICIDIHLLNVKCSQLLLAPWDYKRYCLQFMKLLKWKLCVFSSVSDVVLVDKGAFYFSLWFIQTEHVQSFLETGSILIKLLFHSAKQLLLGFLGNEHAQIKLVPTEHAQSK